MTIGSRPVYSRIAAEVFDICSVLTADDVLSLNVSEQGE